MTTARYDQSFFEYVNSGAVRSARRVLPLFDNLSINSVLDVGCGQGAWLSVWQELGVVDVVGVDGKYVDSTALKISHEKFIVADLQDLFRLGRRFDLVQCLEVAEHLPASSASALVESLTNHADIVFFSAAAKGQGGENHINEQPYDYWRTLFHEFGFVPIDFLRPRIIADEEIEPWYRYNSFLYVRRSKIAELPSEYGAALVEEGEPLRDLSPMAYRLRKLIIGLLPVFAVSALSRARIAFLLRRGKL
jgi:SAM-dependent methyltransferase